MPSQGADELLSPPDDPIVRCKWNDDEDEDGVEFGRRGDNSSFPTGVKGDRGDLVIDSTKGRRKVHIEPEPEGEEEEDDDVDQGSRRRDTDRHRLGHNNNHSNSNGRNKPIVPDGPRIIKLPKDTRPPPPLLDETSLGDLESAKKALQVINMCK